MAHKMLHEITIRVKMLRHLAQSFFQEEKEKEQVLLAKAKSDSSITSPGRRGSYRRCLRAGARIVSEARETGNSVWGKGMKAREAMWLRGAEKLSWKLSERQFKRVKAYSPACKVGGCLCPNTCSSITLDIAIFYGVSAFEGSLTCPMACSRYNDARWHLGMRHPASEVSSGLED